MTTLEEMVTNDSRVRTQMSKEETLVIFTNNIQSQL